MEEISLNSGEISPVLAEVSKFFFRRLNELKNSSDLDKKLQAGLDGLMIREVIAADYGLAIILKIDGDSQPLGKIMLRHLDRLSQLAQDSDQLGVLLSRYFLRLRKFAERDENLQNLNRLYGKAFGGYS